jgi:hypothetical protein
MSPPIYPEPGAASLAGEPLRAFRAFSAEAPGQAVVRQHAHPGEGG